MILKQLVKRTLMLSGFAIFSFGPAFGQPEPIPPPRKPGNLVTAQNTLNGVVRVKASPDECYQSLGTNTLFAFINQLNPAQPCPVGKKPKVNQSYIWGIVADGNFIYFGTTSNGQCLTQGGLVPDPSNLTPYETDSWACEFGVSPYSPTPLPPIIGDFRPPRFYIYNRTTGEVRDISPKVTPTAATPLGLDPLWQTLRGARASMIYTFPGTGRKYVIVAGPLLAAAGALGYFAYDITDITPTTSITALPASARWVGKSQNPAFNNIRRWQALGGIQYAGVGKSGGLGGGVVRFVGNFATVPPAPAPGGPVPVCPACFLTQTVANFDGEGAYITASGNRLFVTTWPKPGQAGMFMSPPVPPTGLVAADADSWTKVWKVSDYEPEPGIVPAYAGGAIAAYGGWIYWGTMNVPLTSLGTFSQTYGPPTTPEARQELVTKGWRPAVLFRGRNFETGTPQIELLYGDAQLWKYATPTGPWIKVNNNSNLVPKFGPAGFGNPYTNYIWSMAVWNNRLYVGTMDWSYMAASVGQLAGLTLPSITGIQAGGDLYVFNNSLTKAVLETAMGFGNQTNYGFRNLLPLSSTSMFIAMANAMNLLPEGGWELIEASPRSTGVGR
jgi:hypothetical protein